MNAPEFGSSGIYDLITAPSDEVAKVRAQALQAALNRDRAFGTSALMGGKWMAPVGQSLMQQAQATQGELAQAPGQREQIALNEAHRAKFNADAQRDQQAYDAENNPANRQFLYQSGVNLAPDLYKGMGDPTQISTPVLTKTLEAARGLAGQREMSRRAQEVAKIRIGGSGHGAGGSASLTPQVLDMYADQAYVTGEAPKIPGLRGPAALEFTSMVMTRANERHPEGIDMAANRGAYQSNMGSLKKLQAQSDTINAFETTALKNMDSFITQAESVVDTGSPLINKPARWLAFNAGNPQVAKFEAARQVAAAEVGKVLNGALSNAQLTQGAAEEAKKLLHPNASLAQIKAAADIIRQDMHNRRVSYDIQIQGIHQRMSARAGSSVSNRVGSGDASAASSNAGGAANEEPDLIFEGGRLVPNPKKGR